MLATSDSPFIKYMLGLVVSIFILSSCYNEYDESLGKKPENLIPRDTIVLILADMEITESVLRQQNNYGIDAGDKTEAYYNMVFTKYHTSKSQFDSSLAYYKGDVEVMNQIYEDVITRLSLLQSEVQMEE
jgi:hypothetical protein